MHRRMPVVLAAVALAIAIATPALGATPRWTITPHQRSTNHDVLEGVSCPTVDDCFAVGWRIFDPVQLGVIRVLIEHWSGDHWTEMRGPNPKDADLTQLFSVSCPTTTSCFAVGRYDTTTGRSSTLAMHWGGKRWSVMHTVNPPARGRHVWLNDISCPRDDDCIAVGTTPTNHALIEHWNGTRWTTMRAADPHRPETVLSGIACPAVANCWAVGSSQTEPIIQHWDGREWVRKAHASVAGKVSSTLVDISCPSTKSCFAVGSAVDSQDNRRPVVQRWEHKTWKVMRTTDQRLGINLNRISCPSTKRCFAVGDNPSSETESSTVIQRWDRGSPWAAMTSPNPWSAAWLLGVSCAKPNRCFAVGTSTDDWANGPYRSLMVQYR